MIDPNLKSLEIQPRCLAPDSAWIGHIPFMCFLVELLQPKTFVELGTHSGSSYFSACQTIQELGREQASSCYAVDTWQGDAHAVYEGNPIFETVQKHNTEHYQEFSTLLRGTFDEALDQFEDGSIDLLHIDGYHTYEAVSNDFNTWKNKLSSRSVVLFHDTNEFQADFGVWKFWDEIRSEYPHFHFGHEHGLGVLLTGSELSPNINDLPSQQNALQCFFYPLAVELKGKVEHAPPPELDQLQHELAQAIENSGKQTTKITELKAKISSLRQQKTDVKNEFNEAKNELQNLAWVSQNKNSIILKLIKPFAKLEGSIKKRLGK